MTGSGTRSWRALAGIGDQVVSSGSNYLTAFVASLVLLPTEFGAFVAAYAVVTILSAGARAVVGEPLLAHLPSVPPASRRALGDSALAVGIGLGLVGSVLCALVWAVGLLAGWPVLAALWTFVPWLPLVFLVDAGRYVLLARSDTVRALVVDVVWVVVQVVVLVPAVVVGSWSPGVIAASWGIGAGAGVVALLVVTPERPTSPWLWLRESRYLAGWFTLTSVLGQSQIYVVLLLAGAALRTADMAGLRAVQLLVFQPPVTFMAAVLVLLTPAMARRSLATDLDGLRRLRQLRRFALLAMAALGAVLLLAVPLRHVLLDVLFPQYTGYAALVAPLVVQTALMGLAVPFQAQVRGFRRGRALFAVQVVVATALVAGAVLGLLAGGVAGLAWGMAASAVVSLATIVAVTRRLQPAPTSTPSVNAAVRAA